MSADLRDDLAATELENTERNKTIMAIGETARRARSQAPSLPHPFETDANLAALLEAATLASVGGSGRGARARAGRLALRWLLPGQAEFNRVLIDLVHQLDHRDRQLREDLADLHQAAAGSEPGRVAE